VWPLLPDRQISISKREREMPKQLTRVGKYVIVEKLAKGGMGSVYKAKHPTLKRYVILKQLTLRGGAGISERFKREAALMIDFRNENIVPVYDHFKSSSSYFIVMEYVDGTSLDKLIEGREHLSNEAAILIFSEVCKGLKYAHDKGVIHRDIKPANILISKNGEVKLVDFGIATTQEADKEGLTQVGMTLGTPSYMSPEQIADSRHVDLRADVYSMGVMLYEMLTGQRPFPGDFTPEAIDRIKKGMYTKPKRINPSIPGFLNHLIRKTMNRKIKRRYRDLSSVLTILSKYTRRFRSHGDIKNKIKRYLDGSQITFPGAFPVGRVKRGGRRPLLKVSLGLVIFFLIAIGGLYLYYRGYYYEYFRARDYGKVEIRAIVPNDYHKKAGSIYAFAQVGNRDRADGIYPVIYSYRLAPKRDILFFWKDEDNESESDGQILTSRVRYLPAGNYELELYLENKKYYTSFYLNPRVIQREHMDTYTKKSLQFILHESDPKPISMDINVTDSSSGISLDQIADISVYLEKADRWIDWKRYIASERLRKYLARELKSGRNYISTIQAPQYYPETVELYVERDLDSIQLDISLIRKSGTLIIESNYEGLGLLIDNQPESYIGEEMKHFIEYGDTVEGVKEFMLSEGNYILTVKKDSRNVRNLQFSIAADQSTRLIVSYDPALKEIQIR
jgi:serine/threonine-protein kinase